MTREESMARMYGEVVTKAEAGRLLNVTQPTIAKMLADGRLDAACEGSKVDVRSIARYIEAPAKENGRARARRMGLARGVDPELLESF